MLGSLIRVPLKTVWLDEARDFTPWLARNAVLLGEALGMDLELDGAEVPVGPFSADLVFDDVTGGGRVVVENQFGKTDHDHIGKLITYAAGLEATAAVLVAEHFKPEHLSAIHWLNSGSRDEIAYFGVEVEVWKIGDSAPAPRLSVVAQPDSWTRSIRPSATTLSALKALYKDWWAELLPELRDTYKGWTNARSPQPQNWMGFPAGRTGLNFNAVVSSGRLQVELYIDLGDIELNDRVFDHLEHNKADIEQRLGEPLEWRRLEERRASRVALVRPGSIDLNQIDQWPEWREWTITHLGLIRDAFTPAISTISIPG